MGKSIKFCEAAKQCGMYGIFDKAKNTGASISESFDASQITKNLYVITAGFKVGGVDAINPITGKALCINGVYENVQSHDHVFPV